MLIFALFAGGFNLLLGHVGELSFGHAMFFAIGAYATALYVKGFSVDLFGLTWTHDPSDNLWIALLLVAALRVRLGDLARAPDRAALERRLLFDDHARVRAGDLLHRLQWSDLTGGEDGLQGIPRPTRLRPSTCATRCTSTCFTAIVVFDLARAAVLAHRSRPSERCCARSARTKSARAFSATT